MVDQIFQLGDESKIKESIKKKLLILPDDTLIYPGHGDPGLVSEERPLYT